MDGSLKLPFDGQDVAARCVAQLLLIDLLQKELLPGSIPFFALRRILCCLEGSFLFAFLFNQQVQLRSLLQRRGFMAGLKRLPGLLKQHRDAASAAAALLLAAIQTKGTAVVQQQRMNSNGISVTPKKEETAEATPAPAAPVDGAAAADVGLKSFALSRYLRFCLWHISQYLITEKQLQRLEVTQKHHLHAAAADGLPPTDTMKALQQAEIAEGNRELTNLSFLISSSVVKGLASLPRAMIESNSSLVLGLLLELTAADSADLRRDVRVTMETILSSLFPNRFFPLRLVPYSALTEAEEASQHAKAL